MAENRDPDPVEEFLNLDRWPLLPERELAGDGRNENSTAPFASSSSWSAGSSSISPPEPLPSPDYPTDAFLVGFIIAHVVGLQYYAGTVSSREMVALTRHPPNPYDVFSIRAMNTQCIQFGHIERHAARLLAPMMDSNLINVEGIVPNVSPTAHKYKVPCQVHIFAKVEAFETVKSAISDGGFQLLSENSSSMAISQAEVMKRKREGLDEKSVDDIFKLLDEPNGKSRALDELEPPKDVIKSELLSHQKQGLGWLVYRENSKDIPPFWEEKDGAYCNVLTNHITNERPKPLQGGIFSDDMGLGKTLTLLSLIAFDKFCGDCPLSAGNANSRSGNASKVDEKEAIVNVIDGNGSRRVTRSRSAAIQEMRRGTKDVEVHDAKGKSICESNAANSVVPRTSTRRKSKALGDSDTADNKRSKIDIKGKSACVPDLLSSETTLVVCPPSVITTWVRQLREHTIPGKLNVYLYYGSRTKDAQKLCEHDIVLTTYSVLSSEDACQDSPIKRIEWRRVILDEAHVIKNANSQQSRAVTKLNAKRRWVVTGTPIQNGPSDLFSLMAFLRFDPLSDKTCWNNVIEKPLALGVETAISWLQVLMATIALRRTKDKALVGLPSKSVEILVIDLSDKERDVYDKMEVEARRIIKQYILGENLVRNYSTVLSILVRLRQLCNALDLCPSDIREMLPTLEDVKNNPKLLEKMLSVLEEGEDFDCPICMCTPTNPVITSCAHIFCQACILKTIRRATACCPLCRHELADSDLFCSPPNLLDKDGAMGSCSIFSSKVAALLKCLSETRERSPSTKSVIFSQFRKMLLLLEEPLRAAGFKILRLDGTMNARKRAKIVEEFEVPAPDGPTLLLASLKASGAGLNLTVASRVYLLEPWWNPAIEEQAMDRVYRIGQTEDVKIVRMIARNTIEERILELQEKKKLLARKAFGRKGPQNQREIRSQDLITLMHL